MLTFNALYRPFTANPFLSGSKQGYREMIPCEALKPYIACYWEESAEKEGKDTYENTYSETLVIPDTCMDIIVNVNRKYQVVTGCLCGMFDRPFLSEHKDRADVTCFAVRFHFWGAHIFLNLDFKETRNRKIGLEDLGKDWELLFAGFPFLPDTGEWIRQTEAFLLKKLNDRRENPNLFNSIHKILSGAGRGSIQEICAHSCVSQRHLERLFQHQVGMPIKSIANLVRYQNVWRDVLLHEDFNVQDAVYRYGYTDQAHLLKEFKRFHGVTPREAKQIADKNR